MTSINNRGRPPHPDILTPAEWKVTEGVRHGLTNPQIAKRLGVSLNAVKFHVANILSKLGLKTRSELRVWQGVRADSKLAQNETDTGNHQLHAIGQVARQVSDVEKATVWFRDVLGLEHLYSFGDLAFFDCGGTRIFLKQGDPSVNSIIYFSVNDIQKSHADLVERDIQIVSAPHMIHRHADGTEEWMAFFSDMDNQPLGLMAKITNPNSDAWEEEKK